MVVTFLSITSDVDKLARDVVTDDFDTNAIIKEQKAAYSKIGSKTHKYNWGEDNPNDPRLPAVAKAEQQLAASYLIEYYGSGTAEELDAIDSLRRAAKDTIDSLIEESTDLSTDETTNILESVYESYPASLLDNTEAIPYRSMNVSI